MIDFAMLPRISAFALPLTLTACTTTPGNRSADSKGQDTPPASAGDKAPAQAETKSGNKAATPTSLASIKFAPPFNGKPIKSKRLDNGVLVEDFVEGEGEPVSQGLQASIHYTGYLTNGNKFDSSLDRGSPFTFPLGQGRVIKGWDTGVVGMKPGGKRRLVIPAEQGYGSRDKGKIPPNSTLVFTLELVGVQGPPKGAAAFAGEPKSKTEKPGGLIVEVFAEGSGDAAAPGDTLSVHYTGKLKTGEQFDSSIPRGRPITFPLGQGRVIKGWDQGLEGMRVGELRRLTIPAELAYGAQARPKIPANSTLVFTVELTALTKKRK